MEQPHNQEEKQEINSDSSPSLQFKQNEQKEPTKQYFTTKCKWISFSVSFFVLAGIGEIDQLKNCKSNNKDYCIGIFLGIYLSQITSSAPTLKKFQNNDYIQVDEICMYHSSKQIQNCTQIEMKTSTYVNDINEKNASRLVVLKSLKVRTFNNNSDGTREYNEMIDENTEIEQQIKKFLRILQSTGKDNLCEGIPADDLTVVTDQQTGAVQQIGVPVGIPDLILQPLVSNIIHIAPNVAESTNNAGSNGNRLLKEDYSNVYYIGKEVFIPKTSKTKSWFGNTVIRKTISQSDQIDGSSKGINIFDMFEQSQETSLDNNNYLVSSHITTTSKFSSYVQTDNATENTDDLMNKSETEITNDSDLITVETKSDEDLTNALTEIQNKQTIQYFTIQDLQDKIQSQTQDQDQVNDQDSQGGNRLLQDENGEVISIEEPESKPQESECLYSIFDQNKILKEVKVLKQKIGLKAQFKGEVKEGIVSGFLKACVSLNGDCVVDLHKRNFLFNGQPFQTFQEQRSNSQRIFNARIIIMGYPLTLGADYSYTSGYIESVIKTEEEFGISEYLSASLSVTAYGELNLVYIIKIRAGVQGYVFKGFTNGIAQFRVNQTDNAIIPQQYFVLLDFQIEALTFDVYATYQHITLRWTRKCIGRRWWKFCWYFPTIGYSNWSDVYRKSFPIALIQARKTIFEIISKCY